MSSERLEAMLGRAYALAAQVIDDNAVRDETALQSLAEEVSGECAELLALLDQEWGAFESLAVIDTELLEITQRLSDGAIQLPFGEKE
jgi:hypothetical protein